jgi:hypothetical protein
MRLPLSFVLLSSLCALCLCGESPAEDPCVSGQPVGQRPGPYAFEVVTGPQRGQSCCYICETGDKPAAVVFARGLTGPLGRLAAGLDRAATDGQPAGFRTWLTLLAPAVGEDAHLVEWGQKYALRMPLGTFADADGPPAYRLNRAADVTVLLFVKKKVVANFAFRAGELTDAKADDVVAALKKLQ